MEKKKMYSSSLVVLLARLRKIFWIPETVFEKVTLNLMEMDRKTLIRLLSSGFPHISTYQSDYIWNNIFPYNSIKFNNIFVIFENAEIRKN